MDASTITEGPLTGLPVWIKDLRNIFLSYGQQISELTADKAQLEFAVSEIAQAIVLNMPDEIGKGDPEGAETVTECATRLIIDYARMKMQFDPVMDRLTQLESELELLKSQQSLET
jgi:hypothetical protein